VKSKIRITRHLFSKIISKKEHLKANKKGGYNVNTKE